MKDRVLQPVRRRVGLWLGLRLLLAAAAGLGGVLLLLVLADAVLELPEGMRVLVPWLTGLLLVAAGAAGLAGWRRITDARLARWFEKANPQLGSRLINAVQLAGQSVTTGPGEMFRREAVVLGRAAAGGLRPWLVVRRRMQRAGLAVGGVLAAWLVLWLAGDDLISTVWPRLWDAHGDYPPYSRLRIEVRADGTNVLYGGQVEVRAVTHGQPAEKLWLVARAGTNETRAIMFLAPDRSFFQTLVNLREPTEFFVTDGTARSRRYAVGIRYTPQITMVEASLTFPEYTGKPVRSGKLGDEPQSLPEGTRVAFRVASNRPLKSGGLGLTPVLGGQRREITLLPETQNTVVTGAFVLKEAVVFDLNVRDVAGSDGVEPRRGRFNLLPDRPPRITVLEPGRDAVATPDFRVPVRVQAQDDYGVARLVWLRRHNQSLERPLEMKLVSKAGPQAVEADGVFDLGQLGVRPGDVIEYYFEASDHYPAGPNVAFSRPYRLQIISRADYENILRQAVARKALFEQYFKLDAWMRRLAEHARSAAAQAEKGDPAARSAAEEVARDMAGLDEALAKALQDPVMFDVENAFHATLAEQRAQLQSAAGQWKNALGGGATDAAALKKLGDTLTAMNQVQDEKVEQPAQQLASVARLVSQADAFARLTQQQAGLAQMLRRFADKTNALSRLEQAEVQELSKQQQKIGAALHELMVQLPGLLEQVPADPQFDSLRAEAAKFVVAVADARIEEYLEQAAKTLDEPDTQAGQRLAQKAAEEMGKLVARCNSLGQEAQECTAAHFKPKLNQPGLGGSLQQILAAMNTGNGQGGRDGYGLFNEDVALFGPNVELAGEQAGGRGESGRPIGRSPEVLSDNPPAGDAPAEEIHGPVKLQPDARFPLRYRDLVGEYFRIMAETGKEGGK